MSLPVHWVFAQTMCVMVIPTRVVQRMGCQYVEVVLQAPCEGQHPYMHENAALRLTYTKISYRSSVCFSPWHCDAQSMKASRDETSSRLLLSTRVAHEVRSPSSQAKRQVVQTTAITGQDGSYLAELLLGKGYEVYILGTQSHVRTSFGTSEFFADVGGLGVLLLLKRHSVCWPREADQGLPGLDGRTVRLDPRGAAE